MQFLDAPQAENLYIVVDQAETVRQRLDILDFELAATDVLMEESARMLRNAGKEWTPTFASHVAHDVDVSIHNRGVFSRRATARERNHAPKDAYPSWFRQRRT